MNKNLETAIKAALKAGEAIMEIYNSNFIVDYKEDKSPLTEADRRANNIINFFLESTNTPIISEENNEKSYSERKNWQTCWIVDPLDGTKEFIKKNGEFTVNIALIENKKPLLGVIYAPTTKTLFFGDVTTKTAYKAKLNRHDSSISEVLNNTLPLKQGKKISDTIRVVSSRSHLNDDTKNFIETLKSKNKNIKIISKGSSLKFCLIADGEADIYPRYAPTMEWDTAAGHAICNAVNIEVISLDTNKAMLYNKENLLNSKFIVSSQKSVFN